MAYAIFKSDRAIGYYFTGGRWSDEKANAKRYSTKAAAEADVPKALKMNAVGKRKRRDVQIREV